MKESELVRAIRDFLTILENQGKIDWFERLQAGSLVVLRGDRPYKVQLCRTGTPDFIVLQEGVPHFFECKKKGSKLSEEQVAFADRMYRQGVPFYKVDKIEDAIGILDEAH